MAEFVIGGDGQADGIVVVGDPAQAAIRRVVGRVSAFDIQ